MCTHNARRTPTIFSRFINFSWSLFQWGFVLALVATLVGGAYVYLHLDDEIRRQVETRLATHYQGLEVHVGSAQFEQNTGITIRDISFSDPKGGKPPQTMLVVDELFLAGKMSIEQLLSDTLPIESIVVRRPRITALRQGDGRWNVQSLVPPPKFSDQAPPIVIEDATVTLKQIERPTARPIVVRSIHLELTPLASNIADDSNGNRGRYRAVGSAAGFSAGDLQINGELGLSNGSLDVTASADGLEVSPELISSLPVEFPVAFDEVEIAGRTSLAVRLVRNAATAGKIAWSAQGRIDRGRLQYAGLPQPLTNVSCQVVADASHLSVTEMTAAWGTSEVTMACNRNGWAANSPLGLAARVTGFTIDRELVAALPEKLATCWNRFEPIGKFDVELKLAFDGKEWRPTVKAECRGISLTDTEKFPYRISQTTGSIAYTPAIEGGSDQLKFDLTGFGNNQPITIKAELSQLTGDPPDERPRRARVAATNSPQVFAEAKPLFPGVQQSEIADQALQISRYPGAEVSAGPRYHPVGWIEVAGNDIFMHEALLDALDERSQEGRSFVRSLRAQGTFDFRWRAEWADRVQPRAATSLDLTLKDCSILFDKFEYPLRHVQGLVTERNRRWEIHGVEGRGGNDSTVVTCNGITTPATTGSQLDLTFQALNVPLDDSLKQALAESAQQAWNNLRPQGRVDFTAHVTQSPGEAKPSIAVRLQPRERSVSLELVHFPFRLEQVEGIASFADGRVDLQEVRAVHGRMLCHARTGVWQMSKGGWQFTLAGLDVDRLEMQRELVAALPPGLQKVIDRLQPAGSFSMHDSALSFTNQPGAAKVAAAWDVKLDCHQAAFGNNIPVSNVFGIVQFVGQANERNAYTAGELKINSMLWKGMQLTSVRGPMWCDANVCLFGEPAAAQQKVASQPITADAYGGSLTASARIDHAAATSYAVKLAIGGADLARFATERMGGAKELTGKVSSTLWLTNSGQSTRTLQGAGELHVVDGNIYELPVVVSMLKVLRNRAPDTTAFNRCDMNFKVVGDEIIFKQVNLLGDAGSLYGEGKTNFDHKLDLMFYSLMGPADLPNPFKKILGQASKQTLALQVTGTWEVPTIEPKALPGVNDALQRLQTEIEAGAATVSPSAMRDAIAPRR